MCSEWLREHFLYRGRVWYVPKYILVQSLIKLADMSTHLYDCVVPASFCSPGDEKTTLAKGEDGQLDCCVQNDSYPPLDNVHWNHDGQYIASGPTLQFKDFDQNQTGGYECTAYNGYGTPATKRFFVSLDAGGRKIVQPTTVGSSSDL